ncbi:MAG TPA: prolipoprotein diacylglyceryl transferase [Phycisphaerales bacterium]|nr:prolipoprotein diacylglyceryl transferase [Phycisphaerales bacterium]
MMTAVLAAYVHSIDPVAFHLGPLAIRWYGLSYMAGFAVAWVLLQQFSKKGRTPLSTQAVGDLMFYMVIGVLAGGRLGYVLFYDQRLLIDFSSHFPFWGVFAITRGGMSSHGGIVGVILMSIFYSRRYRIAPLHLFDLAAFFCTPGLFFGRIANFVNAELWGRALPQALQSEPPGWSVKYPQEILERWMPALRQGRQTAEQHEAAIARVASDLHITVPPDQLAGVVIAELERRLDLIEQQLGPVIGLDQNFYERVVRLARDSGDLLHEQVTSALSPLLTAYHPSQLYQAVTDGPILFAVLAVVWLRPRKPGVVGGAFLITYGILRLVTELFRQPDAGVELTLNLLTRGQTLSALMIVCGAGMVAWGSRRDVPKMGGLLGKQS